jgi:hypothetical protein
MVGFASRYIINNYFNINIFTEYLHPISLSFYGFITIFAKFIDILLNTLYPEKLLLISTPSDNGNNIKYTDFDFKKFHVLRRLTPAMTHYMNNPTAHNH